MATNEDLTDRSGYIGIGIVAENAILGHEHQIHVFLQDAFPNSRGKLELNPQQFTTKGVDAQGKSYNSKVKTSSTITARWFNEDSNRITPPQVQKGEEVSIYKFNGNDNYWWKPNNRHMHKRVQEVVVEAYAAKPLSAGKEPTPSTPENSYSKTVDTVNGVMEMRMSKANGEVCAWLFQMDGKKGVLTITDQNGNFINIDDGMTEITIHNKENSFIQLDKTTINIQSTKDINMKTETWNVDCKTFNLKADEVNWNIGSSVNMKIGSEFNMNCPTINLVGTVNAGTLNVTGSAGSGNASIKGNTDVQGSTSISGSTTIGGSLSASGPVSFPAGGSISGYD